MKTTKPFTMNHAPTVSSEPRTYTREELDRRLVRRKQKDADLARRAAWKAAQKEAAKGQ
jgi:hypothetical protein